MPSSWFYKLRRKKSARAGQAKDAQEPPSKARSWSPRAPAQILPSSPNRASYYFPSRDRLTPPHPTRHNPRLRNTQFPRVAQANDIVFDVVRVANRRDDRFGGLDVHKAMPELKLRPILTKPAKNGKNESSDSGASAATSPVSRVRRFHVRPGCRRKARVAALPGESKRQKQRRRRKWLYESLPVVKESADPEEDFLESMAEMIAENDVRSAKDLEELLACYLALNAAEHHRAIVGAFRRAWLGVASQRLHD